MKLDFIDMSNLSIAAANMRGNGKDPDVADLMPSIRARGVLVPLLVRPNCSEGRFEIVAGRRRFTAVGAVAREGGAVRPIPCAILDEGDDADALEASMLENLARVQPAMHAAADGNRVVEAAATIDAVGVEVRGEGIEGGRVGDLPSEAMRGGIAVLLDDDALLAVVHAENQARTRALDELHAEQSGPVVRPVLEVVGPDSDIAERRERHGEVLSLFCRWSSRAAASGNGTGPSGGDDARVRRCLLIVNNSVDETSGAVQTVPARGACSS